MERDVTSGESYEAPALIEYGTIEEWTRGRPGQIDISIILFP